MDKLGLKRPQIVERGESDKFGLMQPKIIQRGELDLHTTGVQTNRVKQRGLRQPCLRAAFCDRAMFSCDDVSWYAGYADEAGPSNLPQGETRAN